MDQIFKSLADKNRRIILTLLNEYGEMSVTRIVELTKNISQPTVSNHLGILRKANLVESKVSGRWRVYFLKRETIATLISELSKFTVNGNMAEIKAR